MKKTMFLIACGFSLMTFSSGSWAQRAMPDPSVPEKSAHRTVLTKAQEVKFTEFKTCLNNRPAEAEAYDCSYIMASHSKKHIKVAAKKTTPSPFQTAALKQNMAIGRPGREIQ